MAATRDLVISEHLLPNKFGEEKIKLIVIDFYTSAEMNEGKILLNKN